MTAPARVAVDAWCLGGSAAHRGVGTYIRNVLPGLAADQVLDVVALAGRRVTLPDGVGILTIVRHAPPRWRLAEHRLLLPYDLRRTRADAVWEPTPDPPRRSRRPWVQTLHDVIPLVRDDADLVEERRRWKRYAPRYREAAAVIAVSRHAADEGIRVLDLDPRRVHVCHHGVSPEFHPGPDGPVDPPYLLLVSEWSERKGYAEAFAAVAEVADRGHPHVLRVAGTIAPEKRARIEALRAAAPRPDRVELLGYVDDLPALYRGATAFVGSSRYEGFGLPALEAMASGLPVVAFANSATTEIVGDGGELVDDGDASALAATLVRVVREPRYAAELRERATRRAATFTWERSAACHADILRSVATG